tara:strand:+ start:2199 stop:2357 length:159 start_codon:yes stop_codon:yes gene_type:complete
MYGEYKENRAEMSSIAKIEFEAQNKVIAENINFQRSVSLLEYKAMLEDEKIT